jgi:hypothetical protein
VGRIYIASDSALLYRDTGSAWATIGGSGNITGSGALGQVTFWTGASAVSGDNTFFWDNTNKRLGIGTASPGYKLEVSGNGAFNGNTAVLNANQLELYSALNANYATIKSVGGNIQIGTNGGTTALTISTGQIASFISNVGIGYTPAITGLAVAGSIYQGTNTANSLYEIFCSGNLYSGGISPTNSTFSTNTAMTRTQTGYVCTATLTLTLPTVSGLNNIFYVIANTGATVTVQRNGADTILDKLGVSQTSVVVAAGTRSMFYLGGGSITYQIF